ncbi:MAG: hypothetical protein QME81_05315 [bacterium]|nr:hypothetical protein [bacterium]
MKPESLHKQLNSLTKSGVHIDDRILMLLRREMTHQGSYPNLEQVDIPCQRCGGIVMCGCANTDAGTLDYYMDYFHVCVDCGASEYHELEETNMGGGPLSNGMYSCPMCGRNCLGI